MNLNFGRTVGQGSHQEPQTLDEVVMHCQREDDEMNHLLTDIIKSSKSNYRFKASTNSILIIIGTLMITSPILFTWIESPGIFTIKTDMGLTNLNYFLGGIGIIAFVGYFF